MRIEANEAMSTVAAATSFAILALGWIFGLEISRSDSKAVFINSRTRTRQITSISMANSVVESSR